MQEKPLGNNKSGVHNSKEHYKFKFQNDDFFRQLKPQGAKAEVLWQYNRKRILTLKAEYSYNIF